MTVRFSIIKGVVSSFPVKPVMMHLNFRLQKENKNTRSLTGERPESLDKELNSRRVRERERDTHNKE